MAEDAVRPVVVEHSVGAEAGLLAHPGVYVVAAPGRRPGRVDAADVMDALDGAGADALVLSRPPWCDPDVAPIPALSVVLGREVLWLPPDLPAAAWAAALVASWARTTPAHDLARRAQVAVGLAAMSPANLPARAWGPGGTRVPAMASESLARWCDCAWQPCGWCDAGGLARAPCPACGHRGAQA